MSDTRDRPLSDIEMLTAAALLQVAATRAASATARDALAKDVVVSELEARLRREIERRDVVAVKRTHFDTEKARLKAWVGRSYRGQQIEIDTVLERIRAEVKQATSHELSESFLAAMIIPDFFLGPSVEFSDADVASLRAFLDTQDGGLGDFGPVTAQA